MESLWNEFIHNSILVKLAAAALEIAIGFVVAPMVKQWILRINRKKQKVDYGILTFSASTASILIKFIAIVIALAQIGVNTDVIVGAFSAIGLGVSLALRESMANVASGVQILLTHPFRVGDYIQFQEFEGTCREIQLMYTTLQTYSNEEVIIPNSNLVTDTVVNYSQYPYRRIKLNVETALERDYQGFRTACLKMMEEEPRVLKDPACLTRISGYSTSGNGVIISLICYTSIDDYWDVYYDLTEKIQDLRVSMEISQPIGIVAYQQLKETNQA